MDIRKVKKLIEMLENSELEEIENVDLVIENDLSRASTPVFYLGSSA